MRWLPAIIEVVRVVNRAIPFVERALGHAPGGMKAKMVTGMAEYAMSRIPGFTLTPAVQAALQAKIAADIALLHALAAATAPAPGSLTAAGGGSPSSTITNLPPGAPPVTGIGMPDGVRPLPERLTWPRP